MKIAVVYIHVPGCTVHEQQARAYVASALTNPAGLDHENVVITQHRLPEERIRNEFCKLPEQSYYCHDDSGWDIGGYIALAAKLAGQCDAMLCCGGSTTFRRVGWLARLAEAWQRHGPGFYGTQGSWQMRPHLCTCGFMCAPEHLLQHPFPVIYQADRYDFEHGPNALWKRLSESGFPVKLVTWSGEYDWWDWRTPQNGICAGDQSDCLLWFRINYDYESARKANDTATLRRLEYLFDTLHHAGAVAEIERMRKAASGVG